MKRLPSLVLFAALAPAAHSQSILYTFDANSKKDSFGFSVSSAGDLNKDGFDDVIIGAPNDTAHDRGSVRVLSGADGSVIFAFKGQLAKDYFGRSVSGAGDVNGDGYPDLIIGANGEDTHGPSSGSARVYSGADGSILHVFFGDSQDDQFGWSVSGAGDVDGDGLADLIVGAFLDDNNGSESGSARVFSGADGSTIFTFDGDSPGDMFGQSVSGAGDVNGDGRADLIVGVRWDDNSGTNSGSARVFSGADGTVIHNFYGDSLQDNFGVSVDGAGDVNGDGHVDLIVGAFSGEFNGTRPGSARVFSGLDGSILYTFYGDMDGSYFGISVSRAGDVNGDCYADVIVGATWDNTNGPQSGSARVISGMDGSTLFTFRGESAGDYFGNSVSDAGDMNGDGYADLVIGAPFEDSSGWDAGSARVFSGCDDCDTPIGQNYCGPANFNSTGQSAVITAVGNTKALINSCTLTASQLPQDVWGYFLNSDVQAFRPFPPGSQGNLCVGGRIGRHADQVANTGSVGELIIDVDLTALPRPGGTHAVVAGETWNFQCWFRDANPNPTSNFTDAVSVTFQ